MEIDYDNRKIFREQYEQYAAMDQNGLPIMDAEVESWDGLHGYACIGTPQAREQIYGASLRLIHDYGVQVSQADQVLDGGTPECYNPAHGHPLGKGKWQSEALNRIYSDTRKDGKMFDPDFVLSQEWPGELFIQNLDLYHGRNYDQPRGILGVPLFSYLYHEYIICYGGRLGVLSRRQ